MTELAELREAVTGAIAEKVPEPPEAKRNERLLELQRQLRAISPEVIAGQAEALAKLAEIESEIAAAERDQRMADLAEAEVAERARIAAEEETAKRRAELERRRADFEGKRKTSQKKVEKKIGELVNAIIDLAEVEVELTSLGKRLDSGYHAPNFMNPIYDRLSIRLREFGIDWLDLPYAGRGRIPLGATEK